MTGKQVTLYDGTVADSNSEAWRMECEARSILSLPTKSRRHEYLAKVEAKRGQVKRYELKNLVWEICRARSAGR